MVKINQLWRRWFPVRAEERILGPELARFYENSQPYHEMTRAGDKAMHPQVRFLLALIRQDATYAEIGCGGGAACRAVGEIATVVGFDVSAQAVAHATKVAGPRETYHCARATELPLPNDAVDGAFCFEVLEHVWDPVAVAREMVRIVRPGGFLLLSMPNRFSLDLHLPKRWGVRLLEIILALARASDFAISRRPYLNIQPDIRGEVYPDCDLITAVIPDNFARCLALMGCRIDFWDTTYMRANWDGSSTSLRYQRNAASRFFRHFGDHILILAHKR